MSISLISIFNLKICRASQKCDLILSLFDLSLFHSEKQALHPKSIRLNLLHLPSQSPPHPPLLPLLNAFAPLCSCGETLQGFFARPCTAKPSRTYMGLQHKALLTIVKNIALAHLQGKFCCRFQLNLQGRKVSRSQSTNTQNRAVLGCS